MKDFYATMSLFDIKALKFQQNEVLLTQNEHLIHLRESHQQNKLTVIVNATTEFNKQFVIVQADFLNLDKITIQNYCHTIYLLVSAAMCFNILKIECHITVAK